MKSLTILGTLLLLASAGPAHAQRVATPPRRPGLQYDTVEQTKVKKTALVHWCFEEGNSSHDSPCDSRREYALKVIEIIKRMPPHRITYAMYQELVTDDENGNFRADGWLTFGSVPDELSRTAAGNDELVMYQWKNSDGSNVIGTYRNGHLVSKAQSGLK